MSEKPSDDDWLDEALAESFPASDPLPWSHGDVESQKPEQVAADVKPAMKLPKAPDSAR